MTQKSFPVLEMSCAACAVSVESIVAAQGGVEKAAVNYANQELLVDFDETLISPAALQQAVRSAGYDLIITETDKAGKKEAAQFDYYRQLRRDTWLAGIFSVPVAILGMFFMHLPYVSWIMLLLSAPVVFWFGRRFFTNAWKQASHGMANMDTLVALSTGIAFLFSAFNTVYPRFFQEKGIDAHVYYEAAAIVVFFILLGKLLEEGAKARSSNAIKKLIGLQPKTVRIKMGKLEMDMDIAQLQTGFSILARPGERVAVDGTVLEGQSYVDESSISGEPMAVEKKPGDIVYAGTVNQKGSLLYRADKLGSETLLAQIIRTVELAQGSKAPVQRMVDKIAAIFVPTVLGLSLLTFAIWMVFGGENALAHALLTSVSVLVIACPCALGLATPTAIIAGVGNGAEKGILIKDAESLEIAHSIDTIIFDKTGTITEGQPKVIDVHWVQPESEQLQTMLLALESRSEHPLAEAVVEFLRAKDVIASDLHEFMNRSGQGVEGLDSNNITYRVGSIPWMELCGIELTPSAKTLVANWQNDAYTVVAFAQQQNILALLAISDPIKSGSPEAIAQLKARGLRVLMLTGDNPITAQSVARRCGIDELQAGLLPSGKAAVLRQLHTEGQKIAMVGDGINDSEALALADLSIAMGKGSDIALEVSKMALLSADLRQIPKALDLSKATVRTIRQNLFWAFIYNLIGIPIAAGILYPFTGYLINPMIAGAAMALSSVSVVSNSLRLRNI